MSLNESRSGLNDESLNLSLEQIENNAFAELNGTIQKEATNKFVNQSEIVAAPLKGQNRKSRFLLIRGLTFAKDSQPACVLR